MPTVRRRLLLVTAALLLAAAVGSSVQPSLSPTPVVQAASLTTDLAPTVRHSNIARRVYDNLDRAHYARSPLDDRLSSQIFDLYLESLDGSRSYFLASDIAEFERLRLRLDESIKSGALDPAFAIFGRFRERNRERMNYAISLLGKEPDFALRESFDFDREEAPWPASEQEVNELWRLRVKNDGLSLVLTGKTWAEASDILRKRYERVIKRIDQVSGDDVFETFMNAYARAYDPHSSYFSPRNSEEYRIAMSLSYEGIGASLQLVDDFVTVLSILPGGPAASSDQLSANDRITAVGQGKEGALTDVIGWRLDDVVQLIRGPVGTVVRLQVLPAGAAPGSAERLIEFTRNKVTLEAQAARKEVRKVKRDGQDLAIGIVTVPSFYQDYNARAAGDRNYRSTTRDVRKLIEELRAEKIDGLVIDLRGNGGGSLPEATGLTGLFIKGGPVVQLRETDGTVEVLDDPEPEVAYNGPMAVLVDRFSASASEIFAAAIQDYGRGVVIGQQTYGKGTVQNLIPLDRFALGPRPEFGQLTVTIGKFYRVTGDSTQNRGVTPDILLPSLISTEEVGESTRTSALPWDRIAGVPFVGGERLSPAVALLARSHDQRSVSDPDYRSLLGDVAAVDQLRQQKTVSLNLNERKAEREKLDRERLARENARRAARDLKPLATVEELDNGEAVDVILGEASEIVADMASLPMIAGLKKTS
ncbi:MAG TPA: carboxy terminal-processing peptidase [Steroidobacteraceae bacterium]|nr:carboxy terminal-processing peptidase [Steroidobacteraceae bacterium]